MLSHYFAVMIWGGGGWGPRPPPPIYVSDQGICLSFQLRWRVVYTHEHKRRLLHNWVQCKCHQLHGTWQQGADCMFLFCNGVEGWTQVDSSVCTSGTPSTEILGSSPFLLWITSTFVSQLRSNLTVQKPFHLRDSFQWPDIFLVYFLLKKPW